MCGGGERDERRSTSLWSALEADGKTGDLAERQGRIKATRENSSRLCVGRRKWVAEYGPDLGLILSGSIEKLG
jgi:hypothetical protein